MMQSNPDGVVNKKNMSLYQGSKYIHLFSFIFEMLKVQKPFIYSFQFLLLCIHFLINFIYMHSKYQLILLFI